MELAEHDAASFAREPDVHELPPSFAPLYHSFAFESGKRSNLHYLDDDGTLVFAAGGIVAFTHTLTGLVPFTQYGLRVEEESSCDTDYSDRAANEDSDPGIVSTLSGDVSQMRKERKPAEIVNAWIESDGFGVARGTSMGGCMCFSGLCVVVYVVVYVVDVVFVERYSHTRIV